MIEKDFSNNTGASFGYFFHTFCLFLLTLMFLGFLGYYIYTGQAIEKISNLISFTLLYGFFFSIHYSLKTAIKKNKLYGRIGSFIYGLLLLGAIPIGTLFGIFLMLSMTVAWKESESDDEETVADSN